MEQQEVIPYISPERAVVLEGGSQWTRAGFSGEDKPCVIMPTVVGRHKDNYRVAGDNRVNTATAASQAAGTAGRVYIGYETLPIGNDLLIKYPVESGIPFNYDDLPLVWEYVFREKLEVDVSTTPLLLVEGESMCGKCTREKLTQIAFETFNVPHFYLAPSSSLIVSCSGKKTGISVDVSDAVTRVVPVYESYFLPHCVLKCFHLSSRLVTEQLAALLMKKDKGISLTRSTYNAFDYVKKTMAYVAEDFDKEKQEFSKSQETSYELPDGKVVTVGSERFECAEPLFQPHLADLEMFNGLAQHVVNTVSHCMADIRQDLLSNIVLAGGGSLMPGLAARLQNEIAKELLGRPDLCQLHVQVHALPKRDLLAWKGGSALASSPAFTDICISSEQYDEFGPNLVHSKCF